MLPPQRSRRTSTVFGSSIGVVLVVVGIACTAVHAQAPTPRATELPRPLSGSEAWAAMLGNTIAGTTPDGDFTEFFNADGSFVHVDRDGRAAGHWSLKEQRVCFSYPDEDEVECRRPELEGRHGAFMDTDGTRYAFELLPGNPKGL